MPDAVTSQTLIDERFRTIMVFTNTSDGTGESAIPKVDVSALNGGPVKVHIEKVFYSCFGMAVKILEDASTDVTLLSLQGDGTLDFGDKPLQITGATGSTGDLLFTTVGHTANDTYTIVLWLRKQY